MILLLDTSTPLCQLLLVDGDVRHSYEWQADRQLAKGLLKFIVDNLALHNVTVSDVKGLVVMKGPGSFTGLRIGCTVLNAIAQSEGIPIVGVGGESWQDDGLALLANGTNQQLVVPDYGRPARITKPRK